MLVETLHAQLKPYLAANRWYIAYSGGRDSHALLHALKALSGQVSIPPLIAIHVNHNIQESAKEWEDHCRQVCVDLGIEIKTHSVDLEGKGSIETLARDARYKVFEDTLNENECLLMAHHQSDQVETVLYRLARGTGVKGLVGMPFQRSLGKGELIRPLLDVDKAAIDAYCKDNALEFIDDPSNLSVEMDRNFLRHEAVPLLANRWNNLEGRISRLTHYMQEAESCLESLAKIDAESYLDLENNTFDYSCIKTLGLPRSKNLLRLWLSGLSLSEKKIEQVIDSMIMASEDANPELKLGDKTLRRYQGRLYLCAEEKALPSGLSWNTQNTLLIESLGELELSPSKNLQLEVRFRRGGESIGLKGKDHSTSLKQWFQENHIPPWERERIPLIYHEGELIAIADYAVSRSAGRILGQASINFKRTIE